MNNQLIEKTKEYITGLFNNNCGGHDVGHTLRVYRNAMEIAERELACDKEIVALAALLHDADDHKLFDTKDNYNARSFLKSHHYPVDRMDQICEVINAVSFSRNKGKHPESIEAMIVQDADRLDAMGAIGIVRTFAYGGEHGRSLEDSVQHFYDKLLLLKDGLNTDTAKEMAEKRHDYLLSFLKELEEEGVG